MREFKWFIHQLWFELKFQWILFKMKCWMSYDLWRIHWENKLGL